MKCGLCRESGHNRTTCPQNPPRAASGRLPQAPPDELMRMLISPSQALDLVVEKKTADALANATRQIGDMTRDGLGHLACSDILTALAELDLRAKQISPQMLSSLDDSREAIIRAHAALVAAEKLHMRAKAEILFALGYRQQAATLGFIKPIEPVEATEVVKAVTS